MSGLTLVDTILLVLFAFAVGYAVGFARRSARVKELEDAWRDALVQFEKYPGQFRNTIPAIKRILGEK